MAKPPTLKEYDGLSFADVPRVSRSVDYLKWRADYVKWRENGWIALDLDKKVFRLTEAGRFAS